MRSLATALRYVLFCSLLAFLGSCKQEITSNHPTISLFGSEESQLHHIHNTVELHRNIFLVRYDPDKPNNLEWINCPISATYKYQEAKGRRVESMYINSYQDLQAKVPVQYARFAGFVKNGKALEFNYVTIGSYELLSDFRIPKDDPDCAKATHYVVTLSVGAFNYAEKQAIEGGIEATENTTGIGAGVSAGREKGETTAVGDLASCMDDQAALHGCFTPLQLMMVPLATRHWADEAQEIAPTDDTVVAADTTTNPAPAPDHSDEDTQHTATVGTDLALKVDPDVWSAGMYMGMALERLLIVANRIDVSTDFAFDDKGSTIVAGFLKPDSPQILNRPFEAGKTYAVVGAGSTGANIDVRVADSAGNIIVEDLAEDPNPTVTFTAPATDNYQIELSLKGQDGEFGAVVVMQENGGTRIPAEILQHVFQRLLDAGSFAQAQLLEKGYGGLIFHEGDWSVQGTILYPGEVIRQRGIRLPADAHVFTAVSHEESFNIDLQITDANTGQEWTDLAEDSQPLLVVEADPNTNYEMGVIYGKDEAQGDRQGETLAVSMILRLPK